ncbi:MAG: acetyl-CoA carboxylase biotin carboxylase subunit [Bacteriovoracaceae bacterium]|nr:acetyl-CoA carboxylase biotin carboxylase subunit [Bacteriovoracaceae bacterium]
MLKNIRKVLIANRGEIAVRVIRSCRELGIETVAVYSTADENSLHVKIADESVCIGPPKSKDSYLNIPSILSAAHITGADAIHPGYGFLSENSEFASLCKKMNITFIGPSVSCIEMMGSKIESKILAKRAGVPTLEPIYVKGEADEKILEEAAKLGYPVLIKASAGGGGRGMQRIDQASQLLGSIKKLQTEAELAFGDSTLFIEKYITKPRHIEVQILADKHGNQIHLGERDCTIQRRYQKIVEESPSPVLSEIVREEMFKASLSLAKLVNYDSVGTMEFLYDLDAQKFYFMEMNTRIQVEHPVTEHRVDVDLITEQILVADGSPLRYKQEEIIFRNHVIECRINAEDPWTMTPSPGMVDHYHRPGGLGIRVDDYIYTGYVVPPFYDSLVSKIIVYARNRDECIRRMLRALNDTTIIGIRTNLELHKKILEHEKFRNHDYTTDFLAKEIYSQKN